MLRHGLVVQSGREFIDVHNEDPKPLVSTKTADEILASIARFARSTPAVLQRA
jgi:hypothetical protein